MNPEQFAENLDLKGRMGPVIYAVENISTGKRLVCATTCQSKRLCDQLRYLRARKHYNPELQADLEREPDGHAAFRFILLEIVHRVSQLRLLKRWHIEDAKQRGIALYNVPPPVSRRLLTTDVRSTGTESEARAEADAAIKTLMERLAHLRLTGKDRQQDALGQIEKLIARFSSGHEVQPPEQV